MARKKGSKNKSKGLGDDVAKFTKAIGADMVIKKLMGDDCGCDERQAKLNALFPHHKNLTMTKDQQQIWLMIEPQLRGRSVDFATRERLRIIYNDIFNQKAKPSKCSSCIIKQRDQVRQVYQNVCND